MHTFVCSVLFSRGGFLRTNLSLHVDTIKGEKGRREGKTEQEKGRAKERERAKESKRERERKRHLKNGRV